MTDFADKIRAEALYKDFSKDNTPQKYTLDHNLTFHNNSEGISVPEMDDLPIPSKK